MLTCASLQWAAGLGKGQAFDVGGPSATLISALSSMGPPPEPDLTALVPGCGRAYDALALARHGYAKVVAVDLSQTACDAALEELRSSGDPAAAKVEVLCADYFQLDGDAHSYDLIWDCTFLCALEPAARGRWAEQMRALLAPGGELLTAVFPIGERDGGPPFAMSVPLVRSLLEPVGFEAAVVRDNLPHEEQHRRPSDELSSVRTRGTALVSWRLRSTK